MSESRVAIVTGSSSGIGFEISLMLARHGFITYATMRDLQKSSTLRSIADKEKIPLRCVQLDVTNDMSVKQAIETIVNEANKIDILVNNAGYGLSGAFEDLLINEIKLQFDTNYFGLIRATQAVLPIMRNQRCWNNCQYKFRTWPFWHRNKLSLCKFKICYRRIN